MISRRLAGLSLRQQDLLPGAVDVTQADTTVFLHKIHDAGSAAR
jgi:hypothetical protein